MGEFKELQHEQLSWEPAEDEEWWVKSDIKLLNIELSSFLIGSAFDVS